MLDDAEVVGHVALQLVPALGHLGEELQDARAEIGQARVPLVVSDALVHLAPEPLDGVQVRRAPRASSASGTSARRAGSGAPDAPRRRRTPPGRSAARRAAPRTPEVSGIPCMGPFPVLPRGRENFSIF